MIQNNFFGLSLSHSPAPMLCCFRKYAGTGRKGPTTLIMKSYNPNKVTFTTQKRNKFAY